jgi:hypothetical protein
MKAIFSDAHDNLEALQAVLADAGREQVSGSFLTRVGAFANGT